VEFSESRRQWPHFTVKSSRKLQEVKEHSGIQTKRIVGFHQLFSTLHSRKQDWLKLYNGWANRRCPELGCISTWLETGIGWNSIGKETLSVTVCWSIRICNHVRIKYWRVVWNTTYPVQMMVTVYLEETNGELLFGCKSILKFPPISSTKFQ
jgi:hypothetical protein